MCQHTHYNIYIYILPICFSCYIPLLTASIVQLTLTPDARLQRLWNTSHIKHLLMSLVQPKNNQCERSQDISTVTFSIDSLYIPTYLPSFLPIYHIPTQIYLIPCCSFDKLQLCQIILISDNLLFCTATDKLVKPLRSDLRLILHL